MVYNAYQGKYIIVIYAVGLAHKSLMFETKSKFSCVPLFFLWFMGRPQLAMLDFKHPSLHVFTVKLRKP